MNVLTLKRTPALGALAACIATLSLMFANVGTAQALTEHHFCFGVYVGANGGKCWTGGWYYMKADYANSGEGRVCLNFVKYSGEESLYNCDSVVNEGIYLNEPGFPLAAGEIYNWNSKTIKVYGEFWTE